MKSLQRVVLDSSRAGLFCMLIGGLNCYAQTTSSWLGTSSSSDWFDDDHWTAGVPNGAGHVAQVPGSSAVPPSIETATPVTLGQLIFVGSGAALINGDGRIIFDQPNVGSAVLRASMPEASMVTATLSPQLLIGTDEQLEIEVGGGSTVSLEGGFGASDGQVRKSGAGRLNINAGSPNWNGLISLEGGAVVVNSPDAFGSTSQGTVLNGGTLTLNAVIAEPITLVTGTLLTATSHLNFDGTLTLPAANSARVRGPMRLRGGTTGPGDLSIVATSLAETASEIAPLNHQGSVTLSSGTTTRQFASFHVDNGYLGTTAIDNVQLTVYTPGGLGSPASGTTVTRGMLQLHGASQENVALRDSTLVLWSADESLDELRFAGQITLSNSELNTDRQSRGAQNYVLEQPVFVDAGFNRIATERGALTLARGIEGSGEVVLDPNSNFPINLSGPVGEEIRLEIRSGSVYLLGDFATQQDVLVHNGGRIVITNDQTLKRVRTGTLMRTSCCSSFGSIDVAVGATLTAGHLDLHDGTIRGSVLTDSGLQFTGFLGDRTISHLDTALDVRVLAGELTVDDSLEGRASTNASVVLERTREASILVAQGSVTDADLYLNNGSGFNFGGALRTEPSISSVQFITLNGDLHLGDQGAHIGGASHLRVTGQIDGGDLNLGRRQNDPWVTIAGGPAAYTGASRVFSGELIVAEAGRLSVTSAVELYASGRLHTDILATDGPMVDRIADEIPIRMHGGELAVWPTDWDINSRERVGHIELERGISSVHGTHVYLNERASYADLVVGNISREPGAILSLAGGPARRTSSPFLSGSVGEVAAGFVLENPPPLVHGILPAWITHSANFTTYDEEGRLKSYDGPFVSLEDADATSIVRPPSTASTLTSDKTIHALYAFGSVGPIDLGGHTLTVESGGVSGATLANGTIRPGQHANGELIFFGGNTINADIVDNGMPTSVVYTGDVALGGNNSYTGKTYVVGQSGDEVRVHQATALPIGTDLDISGNVGLNLRDVSENATYQFGEIAVRDGGSLFTGCCGSGRPVSASRILLEAGSIAVPLVGATPIVKQTDGTVSMQWSSPGFAGQVEIYDGVLQTGDSGVDGYLAFGQGTVNVWPEGRLVLSPVALAAGTNLPVPQIQLRGGSLFGGAFVDDGHANLRGTLEVMQDSTIFLLNGFVDRPVSTDFVVQGNVHVHPARTLEIVGNAYDREGLVVTGTLQLDPGSVLAGDGTILSRVTIDDGAILSPGLKEGPASVGRLSTSRPILASEQSRSQMVWGPDGRYRWEINDADGDAGAPFGRGWDVTGVGVLLEINATDTAPFVIEPVALTPDGEIGLLDGLEFNTPYRWLIAQTDTVNTFTPRIERFSPDKFMIDVSTFQRVYPQARADSFWLDRDSNGIFLNVLLVPEPSATLMLLAAAVAVSCGRTRGVRMSPSLREGRA